MNGILILLVVVAIVVAIVWGTRQSKINKLKPVIISSLEKGLSQEIVTVLLARNETKLKGRVLTESEVSELRKIVASVAASQESQQAPTIQGDIMKYLAAGTPPIILQYKEKIVSIIPAVGLREPRSIRVSRGKYGSSSVKVIKGVYIRGGTSTTRSESHEELRDIDGGDLIISNQRLVFMGPKKTINVPLKKMVSIDPLSDSIILRKSGKERAQYFIWPKNLFTNIEGQAPFEGSHLKALIEAQAVSN